MKTSWSSSLKRYLIGLVALLAANACVAASLRPCNKRVPEELTMAWQRRDPGASHLVRQVLEDSLHKTYCYDISARDDAFDLIRDARLVGSMAPLLREVAEMDFKPARDYQQTWDLVSIRRSLDILTKIGDREAVALNGRRITSDTWLQSVAVKNLGRLEAWSYTGEIVKVLSEIPLDEEHRDVVINTLAFLKEAPRATPAECSRFREVAVAYRACFDEPDAAWRCGDLVHSMASLSERFHCVTR
jgi:hypothetical protein